MRDNSAMVELQIIRTFHLKVKQDDHEDEKWHRWKPVDKCKQGTTAECDFNCTPSRFFKTTKF